MIEAKGIIYIKATEGEETKAWITIRKSLGNGLVELDEDIS